MRFLIGPVSSPKLAVLAADHEPVTGPKSLAKTADLEPVLGQYEIT